MAAIFTIFLLFALPPLGLMLSTLLINIFYIFVAGKEKHLVRFMNQMRLEQMFVEGKYMVIYLENEVLNHHDLGFRLWEKKDTSCDDESARCGCPLPENPGPNHPILQQWKSLIVVAGSTYKYDIENSNFAKQVRKIIDFEYAVQCLRFNEIFHIIDTAINFIFFEKNWQFWEVWHTTVRNLDKHFFWQNSFYSLAFPFMPNKAGNSKADHLKKKYETNPLIIFVSNLRAIFITRHSNSRCHRITF